MRKSCTLDGALSLMLIREGTVFQSPEMYELFLNSPRMKPVVIALADKGTSSLKGLLVGVTIREMKGPAGYFSSRTVIYGGPLIAPAQLTRLKFSKKLLDSLIRQVRNHAIFIQFRISATRSQC